MQGIGTWIVFANKVIVFGTGDGVFVYSGTPALGNGPIAWVSGGTEDPYGNAITPTIGTIDPSTGIGTNLVNATLNFIGNALTTDGFLSQQLNGSGSSSQPQMNLSGASNGNNVPQILLLGESEDATAAAEIIIQALSLSPLEGVPVTVRVNGQVYATTPGAQTTETWHTMPGFVTDYSHGSPAPSYKLNADNTVSFAGEVSVASGSAGAKFVTLPSSAYFPISAKKFAVPISAGTPPTGGNPQVTIDTSGGITFSAPPTGAAFTFALDVCRYPLDY